MFSLLCGDRYAYESQLDLEVRVARIFNTFGPRMHPNDGRVVSNFIIQVRILILLFCFCTKCSFSLSLFAYPSRIPFCGM